MNNAVRVYSLLVSLGSIHTNTIRNLTKELLELSELIPPRFDFLDKRQDITQMFSPTQKRLIIKCLLDTDDLRKLDGLLVEAEKAYDIIDHNVISSFNNKEPASKNDSTPIVKKLKPKKVMKNNSSTTVGKVGHRFISKGRTAYKIHVPDSSITVQHLSVGFIKLGEKEALKIAIKKRNQLGKKFWGKHWKRILEDELLLGRLPRSLEPTLVYKPTPTLSDPDKKELCYLTKWRVLNTNSGKYQYKTVVRSIGKYGKLSAYIQTKSALLEAYSDILPIIEHIGRYSFAKFK